MGFFSRFWDGFRARTTYIVGSGARAAPRLRSIEEQEICRSILDCIASHTAKGQVLHIVQDEKGRVREIKRSSSYTKLFQRPNPMMSQQDFLYALTWQLCEKNTALAWIKWDGARPSEIWPLAYSAFEFREIIGGGYAVQFADLDGTAHILPLEDMIILRRQYDGAGVAGQDNSAVLHAIELVDQLDDSLTDAVNISNRVHGLLKQKKAMLAPEAIVKSQNDFRARMNEAAKSGNGIVGLDASEEYIPLNVASWSANSLQMKQIAGRLYGYWRTPEDVVNNTASEQTIQNFYDSVIETLWAEMEQAFTAALFSRRELDVGNRILIYSGAATGASWATKLNILNTTKECGELTINERRELLGYAPVEDGDERQVSLNYVRAKDQSKYQTGADSDAPAAKQAGEPHAEVQPAEGGEAENAV